MRKIKTLFISLFASLMIFGLNTKVEFKTLEVRDVLSEEITKEVSGRIVRKQANEVPENKISEVKAQVSAAKNGKRDIRFVVGLDSYKYEGAKFDINIKDGERIVRSYLNKEINSVYIGLIANGETKTASEVFGSEYNYLMAFTIKQIPAYAWDYTFEITSSVLPQDSTDWVNSSVAEKQIANMAAIDENPTIEIDPACPIYSGTTDLILDNDLSTYIWLDGIPSYVDFTLPKETEITSLDIAFANQYGYTSLASGTTVSYLDANGDFVTLGHIDANNFNMEYDTDVRSFTTSKIRISGSIGAYYSIAEFSYNYKDEMTYDVILNDVGGIYHGSPLALFDGNTADINSTMLLDRLPGVNGYIDIDLRKDTKISDLTLVPYVAGVGMPRVQYRAENEDTFTTLTENAADGYKKDLRSQNITARYIRLTTLQDSNYYEWINYKEIVINGLSSNTPTLHLEGHNTSIYSGDFLDVFDGDNSTYIWNNFATEAGDAYVFTYEKPITLHNLYAYFRTGVPTEICRYDSIAYKVAGTDEWTNIEFAYHGDTNAVFVELEQPVENVVQIKLYSSVSLGGVWSGLADFATNLGVTFSNGLSKEYALSPVEGVIDGSALSFLNKVLDEHDYSFYWIASGVSADDFLVIDLGTVRHMNTLNILFKNLYQDSAANFTTIEVSTNGYDWSSPISCGNNTFNHEFSSTAHVRFIRLSGENGAWPSVASISFKAAY